MFAESMKLSSVQVKMSNAVKDIYSSSYFFFCILKLLGLAPYSFDKKSHKLKMIPWNYFEFFLSISVWITLTVFSIKRHQENLYFQTSESKLLDRLWKYQYLIQNFFAVFTVIFNFIMRKYVESFLKCIHNFDLTFERYNWSFGVTHSKYFIVFIFTCSVLMESTFTVFAVFVLGFYDGVNASETIFQTVSFIIVLEFYLMISMQFILSTFCIFTRLNALVMNIR